MHTKLKSAALLHFYVYLGLFFLVERGVTSSALSFLLFVSFRLVVGVMGCVLCLSVVTALDAERVGRDMAEDCCE